MDTKWSQKKRGGKMCVAVSHKILVRQKKLMISRFFSLESWTHRAEPFSVLIVKKEEPHTVTTPTKPKPFLFNGIKATKTTHTEAKKRKESFSVVGFLFFLLFL